MGLWGRNAEFLKLLFEYLFRVHIGAGGIASAGFLVKCKDETAVVFSDGLPGR